MKSKKIIGIFGLGYVGKSVKAFFERRQDKFDIRSYTLGDSDEQRLLVAQSDLVVVCVPTPSRDDGSCDTSAVEDIISFVFKTNPEALILIKSTIPPGTTNMLKDKFHARIVFSPEYIGEGNYRIPFWKYPHPEDMSWHQFQIFGGDQKDTSAMIQYFLPILGPECKYFQTDSTTAELTKYFVNAWGAMKVTFCNEFYDIAKAFGVDYAELRELALQDGRIERSHTAVFEENRGFGGKCYPKDMAGIVKASESAGYEPELLKQGIKSNKKFRKEQ